MPNNRAKKLLKNTIVLSFGTLCTKGLMFIMTPLFTRWLTQNEYGTFDLITTYVSLLIPFMSLCIGEAAFRFLAEDDEKSDNEIISSSLTVAIIGFIISLLITSLLFILVKSLREIIPYFIILLVFEAINTFLVWIIRGIKKLPIYAISNVIFSICVSFFSVLFIYILKLGLFGIVISYSLGYLFSSILLIFVIRKSTKISFSQIKLRLIKKMLKYSIPLIPNSISWWIVHVSDRTIVSMFLGISQNAVYSVANKIPNLCQTFFGIFHMSWQESAIESMNDEDKNIYFSQIFNNTIKVLSSICIVILSYNYLFFTYLFSTSYFNGYYHVPILILSLIFSSISQFIGGIYNAMMEPQKNGITTMISALINLLVHLLLIDFIGLFAATISTLVSYVVLFIIRFVDIRKKINLKVEKTIVIYILLFVYFFAMVYINNYFINMFNTFLSVIVFFILNKKMISKIIRKKAKEKNI